MILSSCVYLIGLLCTWMVMPGFCENICPQVAELHSTQQMVADINQAGYTTFTWRRPSDDEGLLACDIEHEPCIPNNDNYSGKVNISGGASEMVIRDVTKSDSGMWQLLDGITGGSFNVCRLVTTKKPHCTINSDDDALNVDLGDELTLKVNITGYYCSETAAFTLTTGDVSQILAQNHTLDDDNDKDIYENNTIDITLTRFGAFTLDYSCHDRTWKIACDGVTKIIKSMPQCNISSDKNTDELDPGGDLTLTAYINGYYCPKAAVFTLTTGDIQKMSQNFSVDNVTNTYINTTFNVTLSHFGNVTLQYTCDGDTWELACGGVKELVGRSTATSAVTQRSNATSAVTQRSTATSKVTQRSTATSEVTQRSTATSKVTQRSTATSKVTQRSTATSAVTQRSTATSKVTQRSTATSPVTQRSTATSAVTQNVKKTVSAPKTFEESPVPMIVGSIVGVVLAIILIVVVVRETCWKCKKTL